MKNFYDIPEDIQKDCDKITKEFNKQMASNFSTFVTSEAEIWYAKNKAFTNRYDRTYQLKNNAILHEKDGDYEYKISFSPKNIKTKPYNVETGKLGSYVDFYGENVASDVLRWEEEGEGSFSIYSYKKGDGIWGSAIQKMIRSIDSLPIRISNLNIPDNIKKDLIDVMKKKLKKQLEQEYKEEFG